MMTPQKTMPSPPSFLRCQPQSIKDQIVTMARTKTYNYILDWLHERGIDPTYDQLRYYLHRTNTLTRYTTISPVKGYKAKVRVYIGALLEYDTPTFTIHNIRLRGSSWTGVTRQLHQDGLIKPMREYAPIRWQIVATKDELRDWMTAQERKPIKSQCPPPPSR